MSRISLVLAMATNGAIGLNGAMPWRIPEDMKHFKAVTMGKPIVMGRKTWDSFPKKPLPGRANIVITRDANWRGDGAVVAHSLDEALAEAGEADEIAVIGGAEIYKLALPRADLVHLTQVHRDFAGDTHMPPFDAAHWRETAREDHATPEGLAYSFVTLERRG
ncbi:MAG TPA: dihydrofolate reductase [Rhizomicrobium sp.]|nr:dihydrofolate reductase [Rhizomicrobium sp.]